jgi:hypothetical protein
MKRPTKATTLLLALSAWALSVPRLAIAAGGVPEATPIQRAAQLVMFVLAFVFGCHFLERLKQKRVIVLASVFGVNLVAVGLTAVVLIPGNEEMSEELLCSGFLWICYPYFAAEGRADTFLLLALGSGVLAFLLTGFQLGAVYLLRLLRRRRAASRSS